MRRVDSYGLAKIKQWEGLRLKAYQDAAGIWTIGYGHTKEAGPPFPHADMVISPQTAEALLKKDLLIYEQSVERLVKVPLDDCQFSALVSLCYNIGTRAFAKSSLLKKLNRGDYNGAADEFLRWIRSGGKIVPGLLNRRRAEISLWNRGCFVASNYIRAEKTSLWREQLPNSLAVLGSSSGLISLGYGSGPVQWALAVALILILFMGCYFFWHKNF